MSRLARLMLMLFVCGAAVLGPEMAYLPQTVIQAQEPAPAEGEAKPAEGEGAEEEAVKSESTFFWLVKTSGLIGFFILCLSIYFIATIIRLFVELRMQVASPPEEVAHCEQMLEGRDFQGIYDYTKASDTFFSRLVSTGIAELPAGLPEARELMDREAEAETVDMERKISMLAVIGSLGPMIGLIGTLKGMIASFGAISKGGQMKASEVAEGISEALVLTFEGVAMAIPAIFFFAFFKNRVSHISVQTLLLADQFIRQAAHAAKPRPAAGGAPARAPARS